MTEILSRERQRTHEDVLAMVAHDLRNPLHRMMATNELLQEDNLPADRRRELTAVARRAADQMRRLIDDLLDAAQIEAGHLTVQPKRTSLGYIVDEAIETCGSSAEEAGVRVRADVPTASAEIQADPQRIHQAICNLLGNAIKFTNRGGEVVVRATSNGAVAIFEVTDSGIGIAAERVPLLFQQFWQGRAGDRRGVGLGLAITKGIVEAHGGNIWVSSAIGRGSTFAFALPQVRAA